MSSRTRRRKRDRVRSQAARGQRRPAPTCPALAVTITRAVPTVLFGVGQLHASAVGLDSTSASGEARSWALIWFSAKSYKNHQTTVQHNWSFHTSRAEATRAAESLAAEQRWVVVDVLVKPKPSERTFDSDLLDKLVREMRREASRGAAERLRVRDHLGSWAHPDDPCLGSFETASGAAGYSPMPAKRFSSSCQSTWR